MVFAILLGLKNPHLREHVWLWFAKTHINVNDVVLPGDFQKRIDVDSWLSGRLKTTTNRSISQPCPQNQKISASCFGVAKPTIAKLITVPVVWWCIKHCSAAVLPNSSSHHMHLVLQKNVTVDRNVCLLLFPPKTTSPLIDECAPPL